MIGLSQTQQKMYQNLEAGDFKARFESAEKAELLDVRTEGEFQFGTISGARNINILSPTFLGEISKLDREKEYFVFCRSGARSAQACSLLSREGFTAYNLLGGIEEWAD